MLAEDIEKNRKQLDENLDDLLGFLQNVPAEITLIDMESQGSLIMELRSLRDVLKDALRKVNKLLSPAELHLCRTIADKIKDGITYHHPKGTITATARGFFEINEPMVFYNWLSLKNDCEMGKTKIDFVNYASSKKERTKLCEELLKDGKKLPSGIKEHIIASVTIRRKSNG